VLAPRSAAAGGFASSLFAAARRPHPPRLRSFFARAIFWESFRFPYNTTNKSANFHHFGRFKRNFRFHQAQNSGFELTFRSRQAFLTKDFSGGSPPVFSFPALRFTLLL